MGAEFAGVIARAVDQGGFRTTSKLGPYQIHSRRGDNAAIVADHSFAVENRHFEPAVVRPVAGRPDDRF
jgi:hypothetical protein